MASVDWQKQTKQKTGAMRVHLGKKERVEMEHSNQDIDKSKSCLNAYIGCNDYSEAYQAMLKRVAEVDKISPPLRVKKDRIICGSLECPCPQSIYEQGRSAEFFEGLHQIYSEYFGEENVHGTCVHYDEMHPYIDKDGFEKMSLAHSHTLVSAYAEWQEPVWARNENGTIKKAPDLYQNGKPKTDKKGNLKMKNVQAKDENGNLIFEKRQGINGKNFEQRPRYNELNNLVQDYCQKTFNTTFMTGEEAQKKSVELLKAEGEVADKKREIEALNRQAEQLRYTIAVLDNQYSNDEKRNAELSIEIAEKENRLAEIYQQTQQLEAYNLDRAERIKACQTTSTNWKKRTDKAFQRAEKPLKGNDENAYQNVSTDKGNYSSKEQKQEVRY